MDDIHLKRNDVYLIKSIIERNGEEQEWGIAPRPLASAFRDIFSKIESVTQIEEISCALRANEKSFYENVHFTDEEFFDVFSYPLEYGTFPKKALTQEAIISAEIAMKYFDTANPVGENLEIDFHGTKIMFTIAGVLETKKKNSSFFPSVLLPLSSLQVLDGSYSLNDWSRFSDATFILTKEKETLTLLQTTFSKFIEIQNKSNKNWAVKKIEFESLSSLSINSYKIRGDISGGYGDPWGRFAMIVLGGLMIIISAINFINTALVNGSKRLTEIAIKKTVGGSRSQIIIQFLSENILLSLIASVLGAILAASFLIPSFENLFTIGLEINRSTFFKLIFYLIVLSAITGIISGGYPAFYISSFNPVSIFRGKLKFTKSNKLSNTLIVLQFSLSVILIVLSVLFVKNQGFIKSKDWGYSYNDLYIIESEDSRALKVLKNHLAQLSTTISISESTHHTGKTFRTVKTLTSKGESDVNLMDVDKNYVQTLGIEFLSDNTFSENANHDQILVNESFIKTFNLAIKNDNQVKIDTNKYFIKGIVKDFQYDDLHSAIDPLILRLNTDVDNVHYLILKASPHELSSITIDATKYWKTLSDLPYIGYSQNSIFESYLTFIKGHTIIIIFIAFVSVTLSISGIVGIVSLNYNSRKNELAIRKINGASVWSLVKLLSKHYTYLIGCSILFGIPLTIFVANLLFTQFYTYSSPISLFSVFGGVFILIISAFIPIIGLLKVLQNFDIVNSLKD
jgi:ABC-type antimicrobial peptide transport system permease subunit